MRRNVSLWAWSAFVLLHVAVAAPAWAIGGPAQTKRERLEAAGRTTGRTEAAVPSSEGLREEIERSFLLEDFSAAERLARDYLKNSASEQDARDVEYLRAVSLLKLRRPDEARPILERLLTGSRSQRERGRLESSLAQTHPSAGPPAPPQARVTILPPAAPVRRQQAVEEMPRFSVQIGSFSKEKNAQSLLRQLSERRYTAYIDRSGTALYRVRVGPLDSREEAVRTEGLLKKDGYPAKIIP